jgi:HD-GYP domain-containing protein (c-di-GMP phosphodiesterase class II)
VEIGYRIAQASGEFAHLADIILYQHEWWNGQGYPHGLKGEKIPLMSRIISIMDAYDLMTHPHKDKPAMTAEEALLELGREAGSRFDPSLVELFTGMVREIDSPKDMCQGG